MEEILKKEVDRLVRINDELEKNAVSRIEEINKNVLTICEIVKTLQHSSFG